MTEMTSRTINNIPQLCYGTAWKKDRTRNLVYQALKAGFRGVDTAAQPKHYQEHLVGEGIRDAIKEGIVKREELYIQTKFTSIHGQDPQRIPYNASSSITDQVKTSIASSLHNLRETDSTAAQDESNYIDCLVLHSPYPHAYQTFEAWRTMETFVPQKVRTLGISNIYSLPALQSLWNSAQVKPSVVQNRFHAPTNYDSAIRTFCREHEITYQSFWTLTANPHLLSSDPVQGVAKEASKPRNPDDYSDGASYSSGVHVSPEAALYALVIGDEGCMSVLDGTTNSQRMEEDLQGVEEVQLWASWEPDGWEHNEELFRGLIGDRL